MDFDEMSKSDLVKELTTREKRISDLVHAMQRQSLEGGYPPPTRAVKADLEHPSEARDDEAVIPEHRKEDAMMSLQANDIFALLAEESPNMIFVNRKGRVVYANKLAAETMEYDVAEFYADDFDFMALIAPESRDLIQENLATHMRGEEVAPYEYALVTRSGRRIDAIINTKLIQLGDDRAILGIVTDITERTRAERALKASIKRYRTLVDTALEAITQTDLNGTITFASKNTVRLHGYDRADQLLGKNALDLIVPEQHDKAREFMRKTLEQGAVRNVAYTMLRRDGSTFVGELNAGVIMGEDGQPEGFLASIRDATERKELEERLRQADKLRALGRLAGGIAHDFNNQLTGIMGFAQLLNTRSRDDRNRDYASKIIAVAEQASQLTQQLLAFARKGNHMAQGIDVHATIEEVCAILEHTIDRRITCAKHLHADPSTIQGDPSQIQNLLLNIAINARDAMPNGGTITFETDVMTVDKGSKADQSEGLAPGRYLRIRVSDTGVGMDEATQDSIFEPFFTTKGVGQGCGMGLPAAFGTVKSHHGAIDVSSQLGHGTTVTILLPSVHADIAEVRGEFPSDVVISGKHILIVDDEESVLAPLTHALTQSDCRVTAFSDAPDAVAFFEKNHAIVDLVVLDLVMPKMHGRDVLLAMQDIEPGVKCILISGHLLAGDINDLLSDGAVTFLQKPFKPADLTGLIAEFTRRAN